MEYQIKKMSYYAENILQSFTNGTVHSVYRRTVNLTDGSRILSIQADGSPLSPLSLVSALTPDEMERLAVVPGDLVCFADGFPGKDCFFLKSAENSRPVSPAFTCRNARRYDLRLSGTIGASFRPALISAIQKSLSLTRTNGLALLFGAKADTDSHLSFLLTAAKNYITRCNELCLCQKYPEAALELTRLLGLGTGLTPSGDDFLCGVLAGLQFSGSSGHAFALCLRDAVKSRLSDTIDISAAFLSCALEDQFSLPVNNLYRFPSPEEILSSFAAIGHSSGSDTLCGILWSLEHI